MSRHFSIEELTRSEVASRKGINNTPPPDALTNLNKLADLLEEVRTYLGLPIIINSAYRSPQVNKQVGGKPTSQHVTGQAADIRVVGLSPQDVVDKIESSTIAYDQLILEYNSWVHISWAQYPRRQALIIDKGGTRAWE